MRRILAGGALALLLAACGSDDGTVLPGPPEAQGEPAGTFLQITVDAGDGTAPESWTLRCDGEDAAHPDGEAACAHLEGLDAPFAPLPAGVVCTEQYGGPETAQVTGRWRGEPVDLRLARTNGCEIAQWDSLGPLLAVG